MLRPAGKVAFPSSVSQNTASDVNQLLFAWGSEVALCWNDVRQCFLQGNGNSKHWERERCLETSDEKDDVMKFERSTTTSTIQQPPEAASSSQTFSITEGSQTTADVPEADSGNSFAS